MHACMHAYIHTYRQTDRQTDRQTYIHTYTNTYIHINILRMRSIRLHLHVRRPDLRHDPQHEDEDQKPGEGAAHLEDDAPELPVPLLHELLHLDVHLGLGLALTMEGHAGPVAAPSPVRGHGRAQSQKDDGDRQEAVREDLLEVRHLRGDDVQVDRMFREAAVEGLPLETPLRHRCSPGGRRLPRTGRPRGGLPVRRREPGGAGSSLTRRTLYRRPAHLRQRT